MNHIESAIRLLFHLPLAWVALVVGIVVAVNGWQPFVDITLYAVQRLAQ
ncbi:MAG: hypothetical protein ACE5OS_04570 [Anaerolineae bacterium]